METDRISASGATPTMPSGPGAGAAPGLGLAVDFGGWWPRPASMVATSVPCSGLTPMLFCPLAVPAPEASLPPATAPFRSGCPASTPLSMTATLTSAPLETSQALVIPDSASQYCLSRLVGLGGGRRRQRRRQAACCKGHRSTAEAVRRNRAVALVIRVQSALLGALHCRRCPDSAEAQGNTIKNIVFAGHWP